MQQYVLVFSDVVIKVLHQGSGIPTLEDQRANLEMMNSIF
jgi:hypothetical protein